METLVFEGREYKLTFEGSEKSWVRSSRSEMGGDYKMYQWQGTGKIEEKGTADVTIFRYFTNPLEAHWSSQFHLHSFERCLFYSYGVVRGNSYKTRNDPDHAVYFELGLATDQLAVIDYFAELILQAIDQAKKETILPAIELPSLSIEELVNRSLIGQPDGQFVLADLIEK